MPQCAKTIYDRFYPHKCARQAHGEEAFCKQHDPKIIAQKEAKKERLRDAKWKMKQENWHRDAICCLLCQDVETETIEKLGTGWLAKYLAEQKG